MHVEEAIASHEWSNFFASDVLFFKNNKITISFLYAKVHTHYAKPCPKISMDHYKMCICISNECCVLGIELHKNMLLKIELQNQNKLNNSRIHRKQCVGEKQTT
jgi:hypothetical protein